MLMETVIRRSFCVVTLSIAAFWLYDIAVKIL